MSAQPGRVGYRSNQIPSAVGTAPYVLFCAKPLSTRMSHSYSNNYVHSSTAPRIEKI
jgi:hypothetical protein